MSYDFNADDIFEMAEQLERNGAKFYRDAAGGISDSDSKAFLLKLAVMEDEHEKAFHSLRTTLTGKEKLPTVFDPQDEAVLYLRALADMRVFFEKKMTGNSMKEILLSAVEAEKDSIVFYIGMKDAVPEKSGRDKIEAIIKEEMGHIRILNSQLKGLEK